MSSVNQQTVIFLGPQGCGKGTQIQLLKDHIAKKDSRPIVHFEMGKTLRQRGEKDDYTGRQTREILSKGNLIPYAISSSLFGLYLMDHIVDGSEHLVTDGFPRTATQVPMFDSAVEFFKRENPTVVCINISEEESIKRLLARGRSDDTEQSIRERLRWSREETMPNIKWFRENPRYKVIDTFGERPIETVHHDIVAQLGV